jgi:energy-coupling factor transport system ATP-binding protein
VQAVITFKGVSYSYLPESPVLRDVNLLIGEGELVAILGENGAGKTTLIKHINGLLKPSKGTVLVNGKDTRESTVASIAKSVGLVFQNPDHQLFAETVEKELGFALTNFGFSQEETSRRVDWAMREFSLEGYRERPPFMLSGGERKRLALASVLSYDPSIIILDEPTTGQDNRQKARLARLLKRLNGEGKTVLVVTHDMEFVADFIPRTILLSSGCVLAEGPTKEILTKRELLAKASLVPPQLVELCWSLGIPPSLQLDEVTGYARRIMGGSQT